MNSSPDQKCRYRIVSPTELELDCGQGKTLISYTIKGDELTLELSGENSALSGGDPTLEYRRID